MRYSEKVGFGYDSGVTSKYNLGTVKIQTNQIRLQRSLLFVGICGLPLYYRAITRLYYRAIIRFKFVTLRLQHFPYLLLYSSIIGAATVVKAVHKAIPIYIGSCNFGQSPIFKYVETICKPPENATLL